MLKPVNNIKPLPAPNEPGAFGVVRKYDIHTGIDIYCNDNDPVYAIEEGIVIAIEAFTGPHAGSPWWNDTWALLIEGSSGVLVYGEITPNGYSIGDRVVEGEHIGNIKQVLKKDKHITPTSMLHFEIHKHGTIKTSWWYHIGEQPSTLIDPTEFIKNIYES